MRWLALMFLLGVPVYAGDKEEVAAVTDPKLRAAINTAIRRGAAYLKKSQRRDGSWRFGPVRTQTAGVTALSLYALAASSVPPRDEHIQRGLAWVKKNWSQYRAGTPYATYSSSLLLLALARIDPVAHNKKIHSLANRIVKGQGANGSWGYTLVGAGDLSNTQFAIMALWMAETHARYRVPKRTWKRIFRHCRDGQTKDGGWGYHAAMDRSSDSMTAAGLFGLVVSAAALDKGRESLPKARASSDARDGLKRLLKGRSYSNLYFSYGLERAATVMDAPPARWYVPGARVIVGLQQKGGRWGGGAYRTSLALLFLTRATQYVISPRRYRKAATTARGPKFPDHVTDRNLKIAFEAYLLAGKAKRPPLRHLFGGAGRASVTFVIGRLTDPELAVREAAFGLLQALVNKPLLFDPKARADERRIMLGPIRTHWERYGPEYEWSETAQRFERS